MMAIKQTSQTKSKFVSFGNPAALQFTTNFSLCAWVYCTNYGTGYPRIISKYPELNASRAYQLGINASSGKAFGSYVYDTSGNQRSAIQTEALTKDVWHHVATTRDHTNKIIKLYIDGIYNAQGTWPSTESVNNGAGNYCVIGDTNSTYNMSLIGSVFDARAYNRVLSAAEIMTIYASRGWDNIVATHRSCVSPGGADGDTIGTGSGAVLDYAPGKNNGTSTSTTPLWAADPFGTVRRSAAA